MDPPTQTPTTGAAVSSSVGYVSIKLPPYWPADPMLWFAQAEAQFQTRGITTEETKYNHIVSALQPEVAVEVRDIVIERPKDKPYSTLKGELIKRTSASQQRRVQILLNEVDLGDGKPTRLLRHMRQLLGEQRIDEGIFKQLFLQRLPPNVQAILASSSDSVGLDHLATLADKIMEVNIPQVTAVTPPAPTPTVATSSDPTLAQQLAALSTQVASIQEQLQKSQQTEQRRSRSRSRSRDRNQNQDFGGKCWYHYTFGPKAHKCTPPCNYSPPSTQGNE